MLEAIFSFPLILSAIFLYLFFITGAYFVFPERYTGRKYEYIKFFLVFFTAYFFAFAVPENITKDVDALKLCFLFFLTPALFVSHLLYRFKTVPKSKTLSFFLLFATLFFFVGIIVVGFLASGME